MYFTVGKKQNILYLFDDKNFNILKITLNEEINSESEKEILFYHNQNQKSIGSELKPEESNSTQYELSIGLFNRCNLKCAYCYKKYEKTETLSLNILKNVLEQKRSFNCNVQFVGTGEVFIDFQYLKEAIKIVKQYTNKIWIVTNGTLLDDEKIEYLIDEKINLTISMDGGVAEYNDKYRVFKNREGSCAIIRRNINRVNHIELKKGSKITKWISVVITGDNQNLIGIFNSFNDISVDFIMYRFYMGNESEFLFNDFEKIRLNIIDYIHYIFLLLQEQNLLASRVINSRDNIFKYLLRIINNQPTFERCGAGNNKSCLFSDGTEYLCDYCAGVPELKNENYNEKNKNSCMHCNYKNICGGECKYERYIGNNFSCSIIPIIIQQIIIELAELQINSEAMYKELKRYCRRIAMYM